MPLSEREQKLCAIIERRRGVLLEDLRLHVGIPTGTGHAPGLDRARAIFRQRCEHLGASTEVIPGEPRPAWLARDGEDPHADIPPTIVCRRLLGAAPERATLIAGHLDTVHDPHGSFRELSLAPDGKTATGPGCVDMKGGLVIAMGALEALEEAGHRVAWSFLFNSDEETGSFHSDAALRSEGGSGRYGAGIALEPAMTKGELAIARGGSGQFMIEGFGKQAHVGRDFASGRSAVDALCRAIVSAHALSDPATGVCTNVGPLWCPTPTNVVPDHAKGWGNARFSSPLEGDRLERALAALNSPAGSELPRVQVHVSLSRPAKPMTPAVERLGLEARAVAEDLGQRLPFGTTGGVCDGNNLQAAGLPTVDTLGVRGGGLHTPQEWIELPSLVERCQLLAVLLLRRSGLG